MARKEDFTEQEWETLQRGVTGAGTLVSLSDRRFFDTFKEAGAIARHLRDAREKSQSELVRELAEKTKGTGFGFTASSDEVERDTLEALGTAKRVLAEKAPGDLEPYRAFVLDVARSVAEAAKGVGANETEALTKIEQALKG
jgi:hypothetical protein